jgi:hypothetical protein
MSSLPSAPKKKRLSERLHPSPQSTFLFRVACPFLSLLFLIMSLASQNPQGESFMPVVVIDISRVDMFKGIYNTVGNAYTEDDSDVDTVESLTTSTILLIANLTSSLMGSMPEHITVTYKNACFSFIERFGYDSAGHVIELQDPAEKARFTNTKVTCQKSKFFDYRALLSDSGYSYMLALSNTDSEVDSSYSVYQQSIDQKSANLRRVPGTLAFLCISQIMIIGVSVWHYMIKRHNERERKSLVLEHILALWTSATFLVAFIVSVSMTLAVQSIISMASSDYSQFGVKMKLGSLYFALLWTVFGLTLLTMASWVGPTWCATPKDEYEDQEVEDALELRSLDTNIDDDALDLSYGMEKLNPFETELRSIDSKSTWLHGSSHGRGRIII